MTANTPKSRKGKGRELQDETLKMVLLSFPQLDINDISTRPMGNAGQDLLLSPKARGVFPFAVECKRTENLHLWEAITQAQENAAKEHLDWAVVARRNGEEAIVILNFAKFLKHIGGQPIPKKAIRNYNRQNGNHRASAPVDPAAKAAFMRAHFPGEVMTK